MRYLTDLIASNFNFKPDRVNYPTCHLTLLKNDLNDSRKDVLGCEAVAVCRWRGGKLIAINYSTLKEKYMIFTITVFQVR